MDTAAMLDIHQELIRVDKLIKESMSTDCRNPRYPGDKRTPARRRRDPVRFSLHYRSALKRILKTVSKRK